MHRLYPTKAVVTTNAQLASQYNADPESGLLASACLTPSEAESMLVDGAVFESILLVNGEGENFVHSMGDASTWDSEIMPSVDRVFVSNDSTEAIRAIQNALRNMQISSMG